MNQRFLKSRNKREGYYGGRISGFNIRRYPEMRINKLRGLASKPDTTESGK